MPLPVTALYASLNALMLVYMVLRVAKLRMARRVLLGDGGDRDLLRAIRAHGNAAETMPLAMILLALIEGSGAPVYAAHLFGAAFTLSRAAHAWHFLTPDAPLSVRRYATILSLATLTFGALALLAYGLVAMF